MDGFFRISLLFLLISIVACTNTTIVETSADEVEIFPNYRNVTIPINIAPLNFKTPSIEKGFVNFSSNSYSFVVPIKESKIDIPTNKWEKIKQDAIDSQIVVTIANNNGRAFEPFVINVASDSIDQYVSYRLIHPQYENWYEMGLYERNLENFKQTTIVANNSLEMACVNCHNFNNRDPKNMIIHVRQADYSGTYVWIDGKATRLSTKTDNTISAFVYPSWHPSNNFIAFSVNDTQQTFHITDPNTIEVYDNRSDVVVYDIKENRYITCDNLFSSSSFETFPSFSPDGTTLYFCTADSVSMPNNYRDVKYALCSIQFDAATKSFGNTVDTLVKGDSISVSFPRVSPDGKYLLYTLSSYGNFSIWHSDADLWLYDLTEKVSQPAFEWNSNQVESFHSWSSNSKWVVFSSRRDDKLITRLYIGHIDENGKLSKPFILPQKDPDYYTRLMKSYNIPEFVSGKIGNMGYEMRNPENVLQVQ